jgi:hypothetical protein
MTKQQIKTGVASIIAGVLAPAALIVPSVSAATVNWSGYAEESDNTTANVANWFDAVPVADDSAVFGVAGNYQEVDNDLVGLSLEKLIFSGNWAGSSSKSYNITGNAITITSSIEAIMTGAGGDHAVKTDVTLGSNATFKTSGVDSLQIGETGTTLDIDTYDLTLQADGGTITLAGEIDGAGDLIVSGDGKINMLAKGATGFSGGVSVSSGTFVTSADTKGNIVINGGTLKGNSSALGTVTMSSGSIEPGLSPGCLTTSDLTLTGGTYAVELNGNTVCTEYDQVTVVGTVDLGSATTLDVQRLSSFDPAVNDTFAIILNDGTDEVQGTFVDKANGSEFTVDGYTYQINYDAGDGNDVLLLVKATPSAPDTGVGSLLSSPFMAIAATMAALAVIGGLKFAEAKRK